MSVQMHLERHAVLGAHGCIGVEMFLLQLQSGVLRLALGEATHSRMYGSSPQYSNEDRHIASVLKAFIERIATLRRSRALDGETGSQYIQEAN